MTTRAEMLARIRAQLGPRARPARADDASAAPSSIPPAERLGRFRSTLERVGGHVHVVRDVRTAEETVAALLAAAGVRRLIVSDDALASACARALPAEIERLEPSAPRAALLSADAGLTGAQLAIAETGTLVLESAREQHRLASLLPPLHIALVPIARLADTLGDALADVRGSADRPPSRTITFVTGPSRTADIELELVVGVHGPKHLHVVLVEDVPSSDLSA